VSVYIALKRKREGERVRGMEGVRGKRERLFMCVSMTILNSAVSDT
jgi:hypothetical protein